MPRYAMFLKELLTNKNKIEEVASITLSEECSGIISNKSSKKEKDPRGFIIPFTIRGMVDEKVLTNLGLSINLMHYKIFQKLGIGKLKLMKMTLQLADRFIHHPMGIIEDILLKMDRFIFPVDFVILDLDDKVEVPLNLWWPFLATSQALIDVKDGRMVLRDGDEEVVLKLRDAMRHSMDFDDTCYALDIVDD